MDSQLWFPIAFIFTGIALVIVGLEMRRSNRIFLDFEARLFAQMDLIRDLHSEVSRLKRKRKRKKKTRPPIKGAGLHL